MIKIKICGLKNNNDISYINALKPDYVGFVFAKSKRQVDKYQAKNLIKNLDIEIKKVGVFVNASYDEINEIARHCNLDILQLHGDENPIFCDSFNYPVWKAIGIKDNESFKKINNYNVDGYVLDTCSSNQYGGTGKKFDWNIAQDTKDKFVILAGGLTVENVEQGIKIVNPRAVDVSSGVEMDGNKDFEKMKRFIEKVRNYNGKFKTNA